MLNFFGILERSDIAGGNIKYLQKTLADPQNVKHRVTI